MNVVVKRVLVGLAVLLVVWLAGGTALVHAGTQGMYARYPATEPRLLLSDADVAGDYPSATVEFTLSDADAAVGVLRGRVYGQENDRGLVVLRHGIWSQHEDYLAFVCALVDRGWRVFAYDALGCGASDGDTVLGFAQSPVDVAAAVAFAQSQPWGQGLPVVLLGHSWGGFGVAGSLDAVEGVAACVALSGFDTPAGILNEGIAKSYGPVAGALLAPCVWIDGHVGAGADFDRQASRAMQQSGVPCLVLHGTGDEVISYDGASILAHAGQLENVRTLTADTPGRNGHNDYFYSPESQAALDAAGAQWEELQARFGGDVPEEEAQAFLGSVDIVACNTADPALIDEIDGFYAEACGR